MTSIKEFMKKPSSNKSVAGAPRNKGRKYEEGLQRGIITLLRCKGYFVFAIPNGGSRNAMEAHNMKLAGVVAGVADLCVMLPEGRTVWLELKRPDIYGINPKTGNRVKAYAQGEQSDCQKEFEKRCQELGHRYYVVRTIDEVVRIFGLSAVDKTVNK